MHPIIIAGSTSLLNRVHVRVRRLNATLDGETYSTTATFPNVHPLFGHSTAALPVCGRSGTSDRAAATSWTLLLLIFGWVPPEMLRETTPQPRLHAIDRSFINGTCHQLLLPG